MKQTYLFSLPSFAAVVLTLSLSSTLRAQTTVIAEPAPTATPMLVQPVAGGTPMEVVPVQPTPAAVIVTTAAPAVVTQTAQHVAEIELSVSRGSVQAYFGQAACGEKVEVGSLKFNVKLPSTATVTKIASRDDDAAGSKHVTPDNPWHATVPFDGSGRFVFNINDWSDDPVVTSCVVKVDGTVVFSGHGSEDDLNGWAKKFFGDGVRKTGSREIAFVLADE